MLQRIESNSPIARRELILLYGPPGAGKTRLGTSLPERFGKVAYIAIDEGSESLASVLAQYRERITVFRPTWEDPIVEAAEVCNTDWRKEGFDTIILDTFSNMTGKWLDFSAKKGYFQKANYIGVPGQPGFHALPDKGHYGGTHGIIRNFVTDLMLKQSTLNIIFICHQQLIADENNAAHTIGGPSLAGRAMTEWLPSRFSTVIHLDRKTKVKIVGGERTEEAKVVAWMAPHGAWIARRNEAGEKGNPLQSLELNIDPINFWRVYDEALPIKEMK